MAAIFTAMAASWPSVKRSASSTTRGVEAAVWKSTKEATSAGYQSGSATGSSSGAVRRPAA